MGNERRIKMRRRENFELRIKHADAPKPMATGWKITIWTIVIVLIVLLGMGVWAYTGRFVEAKVGSQVIKTTDLESRISMNISQQYSQDQLDKMTQEQKQQLYTSAKEQTLQQLIQEKIFFEAAKRQGVSVTDEEYTTESQSIIDTQIKPQIQQQGSVNWEDWLKKQGYQDERQLRDFIKNNQKTQIDFQIFKKKILDDPILNKIKITDEEAKAYYLEIGAKRVSHILIKYDPKTDKAEDGKKALQTITEIKKLLDDKKQTFEQLAKEKSQDKQKDQSGKDAGSAVNGGDLGWYTVDNGQLTTQSSNGQTVGLVKEFNDVAIKLNKDEVSEPVQTQYGYHIIKITDIKLRSESYNITEGVRIAMIKFTTVGKTDEQGNTPPLSADEIKTKENNAKAILADLKAGRTSFEEAVLKNSEDVLTKQNTSSPGEFPYGNDRFEKDQKKNKFWANLADSQAQTQMGYPFEPDVVKTALKTPVGQVAPNYIKTANAIYIIKTVAYRPAKKTSFDEVKDLVKSDMETTKRNDESNNWMKAREDEYGVRTGNAWKSFTAWWDRYIGAPLSDFGLWVKQFMGKGGSTSTASPTQIQPGGDSTTPPPVTPTNK